MGPTPHGRPGRHPLEIFRQRLGQNDNVGIREELLAILDASNTPTLSRTEAEALRAPIRWEDGWKAAKESGLAGIARGQETNDAEALLTRLREVGLFVVPVGELEGWVREVGNKGPKWVVEVLERGLHADPDAPVRAFVEAVAAVS